MILVCKLWGNSFTIIPFAVLKLHRYKCPVFCRAVDSTEELAGHLEEHTAASQPPVQVPGIWFVYFVFDHGVASQNLSLAKRSACGAGRVNRTGKFVSSSEIYI